MAEKQLQADIIKFLRGKGAYVLKNDASYRSGVPDLSFWHPDLCGFIEVKYDQFSSYRPLQHQTMAKLKDMGVFCEVIHSDNGADWQVKLEQWLGDY